MSRPVRGKLLFSLWKAFPYPRKTFLARFGLRRPGWRHQTGQGDPGGPDHRRARRAQAHGTESRERDRFCRGGLPAGTRRGPWPLHPGPAHQNVVLAGRHPRSHAAHPSQVSRLEALGRVPAGRVRCSVPPWRPGRHWRRRRASVNRCGMGLLLHVLSFPALRPDEDTGERRNGCDARCRSRDGFIERHQSNTANQGSHGNGKREDLTACIQPVFCAKAASEAPRIPCAAFSRDGKEAGIVCP